MWLKRAPEYSMNADECADLIKRHVTHLVGSQHHLASAEPGQVGQAGMSAQRDAGTRGVGDRGGHDRGIAGVESTRDVRGADEAQQLIVVTEGQQTEGLSQIGINSDRRLHTVKRYGHASHPPIV